MKKLTETERRTLRTLEGVGHPARVTEIRYPHIALRLARRNLIHLVVEITPAGRAALEEAGGD